MTRDELPPPACLGQHDLFDSIEIDNHIQAQAICRTCPDSAVERCLQILEGVKGSNLIPTGTWAGIGFGISTRQRPECGTNPGYAEHRRRHEEVCLPCLQAHWEHEEGLRRLKAESAARLAASGAPGRWVRQAATHAAERYGVSVNSIYSRSTRMKPTIVAARRVTIFAAFTLGDSQSAIGRSLGRDPSTISHATKTIRHDERLVALEIVDLLSQPVASAG